MWKVIEQTYVLVERIVTVKECFKLFKEIYINKRLLIQFSINDFKSRYAGSFLGILWAFVNPLVMVITYWFVFGMIFKSTVPSGYPTIVNLLTGLVCWFFFSDVLSSATGVFREYSYLVKKVVFNIDILPTAKLVSNFFTHLFFLVIAFAVTIGYGYYPTVQTTQLLYFIFCLAMFLTGLTWLTSSIQPFFPDISQLIGVIMQALMWSVPVLWAPETLSGHPMIMKILKINPMYYIVEGYRSSFLSQGWFWQEHPLQTIYFWIITILLLIIGALTFKRLKPHFSDVL